MTGVEHLTLSIFDHTFFTLLGVCATWLAALVANVPLPGTRARRRKLELAEQQHRVQMAILRGKEDQAIERQLALTRATTHET